MTKAERMRARELTPFQRGFMLGVAMSMGATPTARQISEMLGYAGRSGAQRILARNDLPGVYYVDETHTYHLLIAFDDD